MEQTTYGYNNYSLVDMYSNFMMVCSRSLKMKNGHQLITTKYHMSYGIMSIDFYNFSQNLLSIGITEELLIYRILSEEKYSNLSSTEKQIQVYHTPNSSSTQFAIQTLSLPELFNMSFFHKHILKCSVI